jgi:small-conductance mechanosensitive channel
MAELEKQVTLFAPKLGAGLLILAGFWIASLVSKKLILQFARKSDPAKQDIIELIAQIARIGLMVFGSVTALGTLGVNVSALVAGLGLTGFALGFAFRDALSNILAGVLIVMHRPFLRGDQIAVVGFEGKVVGIDLRYTTLQKDDKIFLIPNSTLFTNPISLTRNHPPPDESQFPAPRADASLLLKTDGHNPATP